MMGFRKGNKRPGNKHSGFTLVELAIVLAVTGVLFLGLYRLLSGGNQQVKDTSVASQHTQLMSSVKAYLSSTDGGQYMAEKGSVGAASNFALPLPSTAPTGADNTACKATLSDTLEKSLCDVLPSGFSTATVNAYGQSYDVQVLIPALSAIGVAPSTYSFMIMTSGGDTIPDASGGRISGQIGNDGGFVYSSNVCNAAFTTTACGSYGAWQASVTGGAPGFGFPASAAFSSGHVASRTFYSPETDSALPWLARQPIPGDTATSTTSSPNYNTMITPLFLGGQNMYMAANANLGIQPPTTPAGIFYLQQGLITDTASSGNAINIDAQNSAAGYATNPLETLSSRCTNIPGGVAYANYQATCGVALQIYGDVNVTGQLQAGVLYAGTFIYQSSDIRLKTDIQPLPHALDEIMKIKPVSFAFKAGGQKGLGVIAQDMETVYPELVVQRPDGMKSVNYDGLVAPLIAAVQELKQENDDLRHQLKEQSLRQDKLEKASRLKTAD